MSGPPGRQWRVEDHPIFYEAMTNPSGEAILYEGTILNKDSFRRLPRAFQSCVCCGLDGWCVEMVQIEGMTRSICEKCLNGNAPMYEGSTCGTKVCRYITCPHHPNKDDRAALHDIYRERGALLGYNKAASLLTQKCDKLLQLN